MPPRLAPRGALHDGRHLPDRRERRGRRGGGPHTADPHRGRRRAHRRERPAGGPPGAIPAPRGLLPDADLHPRTRRGLPRDPDLRRGRGRRSAGRGRGIRRAPLPYGPAGRAGLDFGILKPLVAETARKACDAASPADVQTGPAARHDTPTLARHEALLAGDPTLQELYKQISQNIWETSRKR